MRPKPLLDKIEQVVRLIRSKGVGVYFVTQNPLDVPDKVLAQLGNRVQHALRAFTPRDQKAVRAAAETFRPNPKLDTAQVITELGKGEALVSFLEGNGTPSMVERALIAPPAARIGPVTPEERKAVIGRSPVRGRYDQTVDPESAYEILQRRVQEAADDASGEEPAAPQGRSRPAPQGAPPPNSGGGWGDVLGRRPFARTHDDDRGGGEAGGALGGVAGRLADRPRADARRARQPRRRWRPALEIADRVTACRAGTRTASCPARAGTRA